MNSKEEVGGLSENKMPPVSILPVAPGSLAG